MGSTPTTDEITKARAAWGAWLPDFADIHRPTRTRDNYGGETEVDNVVEVSVSCSLSYMVLPGVEQLVADRQARVADTVIAFPHGVDVAVGDEVVILTENNRTFEVMYIGAPSLIAMGVQAYCRETQ